MVFSTAKWIRVPAKTKLPSFPDFRRTVCVQKPVTRATLYATALGAYEASVNGQPVTDSLFNPGWTVYDKRVQYQTYDVTPLLHGGENRLSFLVANAWAGSDIGNQRPLRAFIDRQILLAELCIDYADGTSTCVGTDERWDVYTSALLFNHLYKGETWDDTVTPEYVCSAAPDDFITESLLPQEGEFVREHERFAVRRLIRTPKGETVLDFGQNLGGYAEIRINGKRGDRIVLTHAEILDNDGNFFTDNLRKADCRVTYILRDGENILKPRFCFQGFRYVRIDEFPNGEIPLSAFTAVAVYSDMERIGSFSCGNQKLNRFYRNVLWSMRSNFIDVPSDCPQRDERLGWTGDAQIFCRTASLTYNTKTFFRKWLSDLAADQREDGFVYRYAPMTHPKGGKSGAGWGDAAVIVPTEVYRNYGDLALLRRQFPMMKKWVDYVHGRGEEEYLWVGDLHYGDWLATDAGDEPYYGATQTDLIASGYYAYILSLLIYAGKELGEDVSEYEALLPNVRHAFHEAFMKDGLPVIYPKGDAFSTERQVKAVTQTSLTLILFFRLYETEEERCKLTDTLVRLIRENGNRLTTGFLGTPYLLHALSENGHTDVAFDLLFQEACPSWLWAVNCGATTTWERWNAVLPDGKFHHAEEMSSFNHYAYGAVYDWIFGVAAGVRIADDGAGFKHLTIEPHPDARFGGYLEVTRKCEGGVFRAKWTEEDGTVRYEYDIPADVVADLTLPDGRTATLTNGTYIF